VVGHPIANCCCTSSKSIPNIELILKGFSTIQMKLRERDLTASAALKRSNAMPDVYAPTFWEREWIPESSSARKACSTSFLVATPMVRASFEEIPNSK
jgi:hypothetical protein